MKGNSQKGKYTLTILVISVIIPLVVAILLFMPEKFITRGEWIKILPHLNGLINTLTTGILLIGFIFIKSGKIKQHKISMITAFSLGVAFLISYLIYHSTSSSTVFGDSNGNRILELEEASKIGPWRYIYLAILTSHILLAIVVVPFVLFSLYYAFTSRFDLHKKTVRYTLPVWLYVSITGVIVYLMINPYYR
jgi:putative membrane protein